MPAASTIQIAAVNEMCLDVLQKRFARSQFHHRRGLKRCIWIIHEHLEIFNAVKFVSPQKIIEQIAVESSVSRK